MKTRNLLLLSLLLFTLIPYVQAYVGGDTVILNHFENCVNMTVSITGNQTIDNNEYTLQNCTEIELNEWFCQCDGTYDLIMITQLNTLNNYTITTNYTISTISDKVIDTTNIFVVNDDIITQAMSYDNEILTFSLVSNGTKTVNISIGDFGCPYKLYINNVNVRFNCDGKYIYFTTHFSEKLVKLDYNYPIASTRRGSDWVYTEEIIVNNTTIINTSITDNNLEDNNIIDDYLPNDIITGNDMITTLNNESEIPIEIEGNDTEIEVQSNESTSQIKNIIIGVLVILTLIIFLIVLNTGDKKCQIK